MEEFQFDRLTRRLFLSGVITATSLLAEADDLAAKGKSKRKRCREKKRVFCSGRCCPKGKRCIGPTCVASCEQPLQCSGEGLAGLCGPDDLCLCTSSFGGSAACLNVPSGQLCAAFTACGLGNACPVGEVCAICGCVVDEPDFRCFPPC